MIVLALRLNIKSKAEFLTNFATLHKFDPLIASNWHNVEWKHIKAYQVPTITFFFSSSPILYDSHHLIHKSEISNVQQASFCQNVVASIAKYWIERHEVCFSARYARRASLISLFFNISITEGYWYRDDVSRDLFIRFAHESGFDPFLAKNWYSIAIDSIHDKV